MGFPPVCCEYVLLPLVNKEVALAMVGQNIAMREVQEDLEEKRRWIQADAM